MASWLTVFGHECERETAESLQSAWMLLPEHPRARFHHLHLQLFGLLLPALVLLCRRQISHPTQSVVTSSDQVICSPRHQLISLAAPLPDLQALHGHSLRYAPPMHDSFHVCVAYELIVIVVLFYHIWDISTS
jgi:hypothetical protein